VEVYLAQKELIKNDLILKKVKLEKQIEKQKLIKQMKE
jgi:hypothetical protein